MFSGIPKIIKHNCFCGLVAFCLLGIAFSATPEGTHIITTPVDVLKDTVLLTQAPVTVDITVAAIYGFDIIPSFSQTVTSDGLSTVTFAYTVINQANTADAVDVTASVLAGWQCRIIQDDDRDGILDPAEQTWLPPRLIVPQGNTVNFILVLIPLSPQSTTATVQVSVNAAAQPYTGFNGISYGGASSWNAQDAVNVEGLFGLFNLKLRTFLQGYYHPQDNTMIPASVMVEFRTTRNVPAAKSYQVLLGPDGWSGTVPITATPGGLYFIYIKHFNHVAVVSDQLVVCSENVTVNITDATNENYVPLFFSPQAKGATSVLRTESNGAFTIRGGEYDNDNVINIVDWSGFTEEWLNGGSQIADFDGNGIIDTRDYGIWLSNNQIKLPLE
jgi:hypothetical protein